MAAIILGSLAAVSFGLFLWQLFLGIRFPLHARVAGAHKPVTVLKPLKGCDDRTAECLQSWLMQRYASEVQVLFGVASPEDPVCEVARALITEHPKADAQLVICPKLLGPNAKVSTLAQLEGHIKHEIVVISDADVWTPEDLLAQLVATLEREDAALACCFYEMPSGTNLPMRLEALATNSDFWTQVLQSAALKPMNFALGAAMAVRREALAKIGGFQSLLEYLADDYQLGNRLAAMGEKIALCNGVVQCRSAAMTWREVCAHQIRWARTIRACQPAPFFFSVIGNPLMWLLVLLAIPHTAGVVCGMLAFRAVAGMWLEKKLTGSPRPSSILLAPLSDILRLLFWASAFLGRRVQWRGREFDVLKGGRLRERT